MDDSAKKMNDAMRGAIGRFAVGGAIDSILNRQHSLVKLAALGGFGDDTLSRAARGLPGREVSDAIAKITTALALFESQRKIGSAFDATTLGVLNGSPLDRALEAAGRFSAFHKVSYPQHLSKAIEAAVRKLNAPFDFPGLSAAKQSTLGIDIGSIGALTRSRQWASAIGAIPDSRIDALLGTSLKASQLDELRRAVGGIDAVTTGLGLADARHGSLHAMLASMEATSSKLSLFAGSIDVLGPGSSSSVAAYDALLGGYSAHEMIARSGMHDRRERTRLYRDLDVDEGLIEGDNAATVAVLVESGVVEGERTRHGTVTALVEAGPVRMRIMASRPKMGAFGAIDAFENGLRAFVSAKLESVQGPNWFKQRVPGDLVGRAKERRREAMRAGEPSLPLIYYIDLGDLVTVIVRKDNWVELFEAVFDRPEPLRVDLERLTANRRPTMHSRPIDPVQLCEIILIIRRLTGWMERDGAWSVGWDADI